MHDVTGHFELLERNLAVSWKQQDVPIFVSHLGQEIRARILTFQSTACCSRLLCSAKPIVVVNELARLLYCPEESQSIQHRFYTSLRL